MHLRVTVLPSLLEPLWGDTGNRQQVAQGCNRTHTHTRERQGFFCVNLIIQIFIYMVRKTSSSSPRHHEAPPDRQPSLSKWEGQQAAPHSPKETRGMGAGGENTQSAPASLTSLVLSSWELRLNLGVFALMPTAHLGHQLSW